MSFIKRQPAKPKANSWPVFALVRRVETMEIGMDRNSPTRYGIGQGIRQRTAELAKVVVGVHHRGGVSLNVSLKPGYVWR